jgi:DNA mismatch endonuclease, patch repair protein
MSINTTSRVKSKDNALERLVFSYLRRNKIYFQKHYSKAPGNPDVALPRKKRAVFINGDFWHGRNFERRRPQLSEYWLGKIQGNMERDMRTARELSDLGWSYLVVWESDLLRKRTSDETLSRIAQFLSD